MLQEEAKGGDAAEGGALEEEQDPDQDRSPAEPARKDSTPDRKQARMIIGTDAVIR